ncbi:myoneurin isoform X2 [Anabrus simplex]
MEVASGNLLAGSDKTYVIEIVDSEGEVSSDVPGSFANINIKCENDTSCPDDSTTNGEMKLENTELKEDNEFESKDNEIYIGDFLEVDTHTDESADADDFIENTDCDLQSYDSSDNVISVEITEVINGEIQHFRYKVRPVSNSVTSSSASSAGNHGKFSNNRSSAASPKQRSTTGHMKKIRSISEKTKRSRRKQLFEQILDEGYMVDTMAKKSALVNSKRKCPSQKRSVVGNSKLSRKKLPLTEIDPLSSPSPKRSVIGKSKRSRKKLPFTEIDPLSTNLSGGLVQSDPLSVDPMPPLSSSNPESVNILRCNNNNDDNNNIGDTSDHSNIEDSGSPQETVPNNTDLLDQTTSHAGTEEKVKAIVEEVLPSNRVVQSHAGTEEKVKAIVEEILPSNRVVQSHAGTEEKVKAAVEEAMPSSHVVKSHAGTEEKIKAVVEEVLPSSRVVQSQHSDSVLMLKKIKRIKKYKSKSIAQKEDNTGRHVPKRDKRDKKIHICNICSKAFTRKSSLNNHINTHNPLREKPFTCNICGKSISSLSYLKTHQASHANPWKCDMCGKNFKFKSYLSVHMRHHFNDRPYMCDLCGKGFTAATCLKKHIRIHTGISPYQCNVCHKYFAQKVCLDIHMPNHTGFKPYLCDVCGKSFPLSSYLVKHMRVEHQSSSSPPPESKPKRRVRSMKRTVKCKICKMTFKDRLLMQHHLRDYHDA